MFKQPKSNRPYSPQISEADLEKQCSDLLALDGWRTLKTDPVSRREWGKGFGEKGMCDRLYIRYQFSVEPESAEFRGFGRQDAELMWIEWKRIRPGRRTAERAEQHQRDWIRDERLRGALVLLAGVDFPATFDGFCAWYAKSGLLRRAGLCGGQAK